jgi:hypothetical protein
MVALQMSVNVFQPPKKEFTVKIHPCVPLLKIQRYLPRLLEYNVHIYPVKYNSIGGVLAASPCRFKPNNIQFVCAAAPLSTQL